jgi:signal transduction histidine kinase
LRKLLYNAVEYSDGQHVVLRVSQTDTTVRFTIQDVGPGLPVDLPEMEYEPFSITDHLPEGHGYRWPLVKRLIVGLGGRLTVDTDYHEGCKIVIEMPK